MRGDSWGSKSINGWLTRMKQKGTTNARTAAVFLLAITLLGLTLGATSCADKQTLGAAASPSSTVPDTREPIGLSGEAGKEHRVVMLQHLETVQAIVAALANEDYALAQGLTEAHLGFFTHRQAMLRQKPEDFPPAYHDLAMAHHEAAEELARVMPSRDLKQILPRLDGVLKACVACHLAYKLHSTNN
ncbi:MAG: hypothetical protein EPO64_11105 [Nitrospirae bacterium]|nr:MAG: hypothetical protein EPO64_11105 [Nitrospirota bacterium]